MNSSKNTKYKQSFAVRPSAQPGKVCRMQTSDGAELLPEGVSLNSPDLPLFYAGLSPCSVSDNLIYHI